MHTKNITLQTYVRKLVAKQMTLLMANSAVNPLPVTSSNCTIQSRLQGNFHTNALFGFKGLNACIHLEANICMKRKRNYSAHIPFAPQTANLVHRMHCKYTLLSIN
jgi:hypothetical protein